MKKNEIGILAEREATVVHCPTSNMKLGTGGTLSYPVHKAEAGVDVRLGTDGPASSASGFDLRMEARVATLVQRYVITGSDLVARSRGMADGSQGQSGLGHMEPR